MVAKARGRAPARQYSDLVKERLRAEYMTNGGNLTRAIRAVDATIPYNTAKRWLKVEDSEKAAKVREEQQAEFIREAYASARKGVTVGNALMGFVLENADKVDEAFKAVAKADIDRLAKGGILQTLASLSKINIKDLAYYIGILYDKGALAEGKPTGIVSGQVNATHEYRITETIIASHPEILELIFTRNQRSGVADGSGPGARPGLGELR